MVYEMLALAHSGAAMHEANPFVGMMTVSVDQKAILSSQVANRSHHPASMKETSSLMRLGRVPGETLRVDASDHAINPNAGSLLAISSSPDMLVPQGTLSMDETFSSSPMHQNGSSFIGDPSADKSYGVYTRDGNSKYYLKVCGNNHCTSQTHNGGWCETFKVQKGPDDKYVLYTEDGGNKYYLRVGGDDQCNSRMDNDDWATKFLLEKLSNGAYGIASTNSANGGKYYLRVCGNNQANSRVGNGGVCEHFFLEQKR